MSKRITIKDIAKLAGVSVGTVDRVLYNRGSVSEASRIAIEKAIEKMEYKPNIHVSALALRKTYKLCITIPQFTEGEYWDALESGIKRAIEKYEGVDISVKFFYYNQFDIYDCRKTFDEVSKYDADAVIIGPTFRDETIYLVSQLEYLKIPYVFVDSVVENTSPLAFFVADPYTCGYIMSKLITGLTPYNSELVLFQAERIGDESANTTILRKRGFLAYLKDKKLTNKLHSVMYSALDSSRNDKLIGDYFEKNPNIHGAIVLNSRGHVIADYFEKKNINNIKLVCIDMTEKNIHAIKSGYIDYLICQRPEAQGYLATKSIIEFLVYRLSFKVDNYLPLDILVNETVCLYEEFNNIDYL